MLNTTKFSESRFLLIIGLVQFIHILDFMMVMPLGPDFAAALGIPVQHLGYIGGSYMLSASLTGLIAALYLDQHDRKKVILFSLAGLGIATILASFATGMTSLVCARILAGMFGGPLASTSIAMVADVIPPERRGAAIGKIMGSFSLASVLGVPFGLELSQLFSWQLPFLTLGCTAFLVYFLARIYLPTRVNEFVLEDIGTRFNRLKVTLNNPLSWYAWGFTGFAVMAAFLLIPNMAAYVQYNIGFPREKLGMLYLCGGSISFFSMRLVGKLVDRTSATFISILSTLLFILVIMLGFIFYRPILQPIIPAVLIFTCFTIALSSRNVAGQALSSQVPLPIERAGFMSIQSSIINMGSASGAFIGSMILYQDADKHLANIHAVGWLAIVISLLIPLLFWRTEARLIARPRQDRNAIMVPEI